MMVSAVLDRLDSVRPSGDGWTARCPAHEDREPSLSVSEGSDGRVLLHCHAGCSFEDVCAALSLDPRGLSSNGSVGSSVRNAALRDPVGAPADRVAI